MPVELTDEPSYPVARKTLEKLARVCDLVLPADRHTKQARRRNVAQMMPRHKGVLQDDLTYRSSANVVVWLPVDGTETETETIIECWAWMIDVDDIVESGTECIIDWIDGRWYVTDSGCSGAAASATQQGVPEADITTDGWEVG